ncbi:hypothetical protein [Burkholderia pseudomallei]|uniref:hypothetical protein n=1 Tax=Burkholderia pseudomallei TaxID=28450 RepID=UPI0022EB0469|nr:hypothetical protein [Burkholderia pseudomallei]
MANSSFAYAVARVFYRPIEAATRWGDPEESEFQILRIVGDEPRVDGDGFFQWPHLRLDIERICNAMANRELPDRHLGITESKFAAARRSLETA